MRMSPLLLVAMLAACGTEYDPSERPLYWNGSNTLTVLLFNGQTGEAVTDAKLQVNIGSTVLAAERSENAYTVTQIPAGTFPIVVSAPGFLDFVATRAFTNNSALNGANTAITYVTNTAVLFPVQSVDEDIEVKVFESGNGARVGSGEIVATIDTSIGVSAPVSSLAEQLQGSFGYLPRVVTATIADGIATLPKDQLVFGATYKLNIINARNADGRYLTSKLNQATFRAGLDFQTMVVFVGPPAVTPVALSANTEDDVLLSKLVVRFPYPVELCSKPTDHGWTNTTTGGPNDPVDTDDDGEVTAPANENPVGVAFSEGATVLTATYATRSNDNGDSLSVEFSGIEVRVVGASSCSELSDVNLRDSNDRVSTTIEVRKVEAD